MMSAREDAATRPDGCGPLALLLGLAVTAFLLLPFYNVIDFDVAFLSWAADKLLHGAVLGRDILEVNPPLCILLYMPAALIAPLTGMEWGVRISMLVLTLMSLATLWHSADERLRGPVGLVALLFVSLALPQHFAQREQIAFLLCAPYVAGRAHSRGWAVLSGVMAGVGFLMKPHFLVPLALVFALRRRIGTEERAIIATGFAYAVLMLVSFRPWITDMVPMALVTYWAISWPWGYVVEQSGLVMLASAPLALAVTPRPPAVFSYFAAALGFSAAAALQMKGFIYHFIPAYGFLALFLTAVMFTSRRPIAIIAAGFLIMEAYMLGRSVLAWRASYAWVSPILAAVDAEIDRSRSYLSLVPDGAAGFPAAIHTSSQYVGIAMFPIFIYAAGSYATGVTEGDPTKANELALSQALRELARQPDLVITWGGPFDIAGRPFDILAWFNSHDEFRAAWKDYALDRKIGPFDLFRRKRSRPSPLPFAPAG